MNRYPTETKRQPVASTTASSRPRAADAGRHRASPYVPTAARAVVNLPVSAVAVAWGRMHGGDCDIHGDLIVTCAGMASGFTKAGTTLGNVWLYRNLGGPDRHRHEARHATQWAVFGLAFPVLYLADCVRQGVTPKGCCSSCRADLRDGGYLR